MARRLRYSRWRRLPGLFRTGEHPAPNPNQELMRLSLYLPAGLLDRAQTLASQAGVDNVQLYCEALLQQAIEAEAMRTKLEESEARRGPLEGLNEVANDPDYLAEWSAAVPVKPAHELDPAPGLAAVVPADGDIVWEFAPDHEPDPAESGPHSIPAAYSAAAVVIRHAGMGPHDPAGFLPSLRRGEAIAPEPARELIQALIDLERSHQHATAIDRQLAYALHRLAFEGQVLLTDAWPTAPVEQGVIDLLRLVQEAVDRVLSGEDIRYFPQESSDPQET